jgi:predicted esterase
MDPAITPHSIRVRRSARYYTLGPTHGFPRELWVVLHGYGQLAARFLAWFGPLDDGTRLVVAPEGLSRFYLDPIAERRGQASPRVGATWMTREDREHEIEDYIAYLEQLSNEIRRHLAGAGPRIVVLGFSQGTATMCRWLAASELRAEQVVLWAGGVPPELDVADWSAKLHGAALTLVAGERDEMVPASAVVQEGERLSAAGVAFTLLRHPGGHRVDGDALLALAAGFEGH